jgi:hippurate hydrolase
MLLGAARHLCETRKFRGSVAVIFQPAEEGGGGGREMVEDGMMERFSIDRVFGMHTEPGLPIGHFGIRTGPIAAAMDEIAITVMGQGGHAAFPHDAVDPVFIGSQIVSALQGVVARNTDPLESLVVSITVFHAGEVINVISPTAELAGTVRTLSEPVRELAEKRIRLTAEGIAKSFGGRGDSRLSSALSSDSESFRESRMASKRPAKSPGLAMSIQRSGPRWEPKILPSC